MALDLSSFDAALKQHYTADRVENMTYEDNPLLALMPKMTDFGGKNLPIPIIYGDPQGVSSTFTTAQANQTSSQLKDFVLTRVKAYSIASIDNETLKASVGNANAFMEAATTEIDGAIHSSARMLAVQMYRSGSGSIGQNQSAATGTAIQLVNPEDVTNFEVGQQLVFSATDGSGTVKSGRSQVVGVDRDLGTLTVNPALTAIAGGAGVAANDYIFVEGNYALGISGLQAWLPNAAPSNTPFFSVDRTSDVTRLAGVRYDGSALPIEEALISAASRVAREGGKPDMAFMSYSKFADLEKALGSKVQYIDLKANADIGFRGMQINGPRGLIKIVPDQNCPSDRCFMLQMNVWKLYSLGKAPQIIDTDGLKMLRASDADSVTVRVGYYAQVGCRGPGWNVNLKLSQYFHILRKQGPGQKSWAFLCLLYCNCIKIRLSDFLC